MLSVIAASQAEKLMRKIGVQNVKLSEYEMSIAAHLVDPLTMQVRNYITVWQSMTLFTSP